MMRSSLARVTFLAVAALSAAPAVAAQERVTAMPQFEWRFATAASPDPGPFVGAGVNVRAGHYARLGVALDAGAVNDGEGWHAQQRVEATARFLFDPFGERARGFYSGAGLGAVRDDEGVVRAVLLGVLGVEGRRDGRIVPALELTLGGGARLAVVLRGRRTAGR